MKNIVYGLRDPRNDVYCYIGKSSIGESRPLSHLTNSHSKDVNDWVKGLADDWQYVKVDIIEEVEDINDLSEREGYWIAFYYDINPDLLNKTGKKEKEITIDLTKHQEELWYMLKTCSMVHEFIKEARVVRNISQDKMSSDIGISRSTLSLAERGANVTFDVIKDCLRYLKGQDIVSNIKKERSR